MGESFRAGLSSMSVGREEMNDNEMTTLWLGATRYYLGRMTYAVTDFCEMLRRAWPALPDETKKLIQRDIEEEFIRDDKAREKSKNLVPFDKVWLPLGHDVDRAEWEKVRELWK